MSVATALGTSAASSSGTTRKWGVLPGVSVATNSERCAAADQCDGVHDGGGDGHAGAVDDDGVVVLRRGDDGGADPHDQGADEQDVRASWCRSAVHRQDLGVGEQDGTPLVVRDDLVEGLGFQFTDTVSVMLIACSSGGRFIGCAMRKCAPASRAGEW